MNRGGKRPMTRVSIDAPGPPWAGGRGTIALPASHRNGFRPRFRRHNKLPQPTAVTQSELALTKQRCPPTQYPEPVSRRPRQLDKALNKRFLRLFWQRQEYHVADARPERGCAFDGTLYCASCLQLLSLHSTASDRLPLAVGCTISGAI
jgi:hypothetical protein